MLRHWPTTTRVAGSTWENKASSSLSELATRLFRTTSPALVARQTQCVDLPTSRPNTAVQVSASGIMVVSFQSSVDRNAASCDTHITWPWRLRPAVSYQSSGAASAPGGNTPRALYGAGADGHPEAPDRRPLGACPYRRQCAECSPSKFIDGLFQTVMGAHIPPACLSHISFHAQTFSLRFARCETARGTICMRDGREATRLKQYLFSS